MPTPQPMPAAKNASFAAMETAGQKTTENMTAKTKNMTAVITGPRRRILCNSLQAIERDLLALAMDSLNWQLTPVRLAHASPAGRAGAGLAPAKPVTAWTGWCMQ
jgi:hypothetical protein